MSKCTISISRLHVAVVAAGIGFATVVSAPANAQEKFPSRPIDMIVNFGPGGGADLMGRQVAELMAKELKVPIPVSNVAGSAGNAGLTKVRTSKADGYTIGTMTGLTVTNWALGMGQMTLKDFTFVGITQSSPSMLFVHVDSSIKNYKDLLKEAKANPKKLRVATAGLGTLDDVAVRYLNAKGYEVVNVPYAKPAERYAAVVGKHTELLYEEPGDVIQFLNANQIRPIVVFDENRYPKWPDVGTAKEDGHDLVHPNWRGVVAPPGLPPAMTKALADALKRAVQTPEWKAFCEKTLSCIDPLTPEQSRKIAQATFDDISKFAEQYGLKQK